MDAHAILYHCPACGYRTHLGTHEHPWDLRGDRHCNECDRPVAVVTGGTVPAESEPTVEPLPGHPIPPII